MKCRITKDQDGVYQAQVWDGSNWLFEPGTTSMTQKETEERLRAARNRPLIVVVKELEL